MNNIGSKIRLALWPIARDELRLFLPMALVMLCILFNFSALRAIKDSLVVPSIGAEVISFLKLWFVLPAAVLFTVVYIKLSNVFHIEHIFYIVVSFLLLIFILFAYVIYPNQEIYHPSKEFINHFLSEYPHAQWFTKLLGKWSYATMYVFSELWSVVVINLMFWQFANHIVSAEQAKRFYPMFGLIGNTGLIAAGNFMVFTTGLFGSELLASNSLDLYSSNGEASAVKLIVSVISISGIISMLLFRYINRVVLHDDQVTVISTHDVYNTKTKLSFSDSVRLILSSKYIGYIVVMIICYGLVINLLEGPWKAKVRELCPSTMEYITFMGKFNIWMGIFAVTFMLIGSNFLRYFDWKTSALVTPSIIGLTGTAFFLFVVFPEYFANTLDVIAFNPLYAAVVAGATQNILSKATKYSLFDSTKEMAYIPLSRELRTKGKAAAEVIGAKLGKSLGAFIQSSIFILAPSATFDSMAPILMAVFLVVIVIWLIDVLKLDKEYIRMSIEDGK
jgi:ADP/ATP carrier protein family